MFIGLRNKFANVTWKIPDRFKDGYGINKRLIEEAYNEGCTLIITVDNGIAAKEQVEYAKSLGIDVIITDHHQLNGDLPSEITVNPHIDDNYPFKSICGCMVAFKVIQALDPDMVQRDLDLFRELLTIATIGTIADAMDLINENRYYLKKGLTLLSNPRNLGLRVLLQKLNLFNKTLNADSVGFLIGPCINAAGRLDSADLALNLLLSDDIVECEKLASKLVALNDQRKQIQKETVDKLQVNEEDKFIIVALENVGHGILGIIAGKISEKYQRPCFVLGGNKEKGTLSGSGRSVYNYNISKCITENTDIAKGGGHAAACGVEINYNNLEGFKKRCNEHFTNWLKNASIDDLTPSLDIACEIDIKLINERLINNINKLQPYGNGNEEPLFVSRKLHVSKSKIVGKNANVVQFGFEQGFYTIKAVGFNDIKEKYEELGNPTEVDVVFTLDLNEWPEGVYTPQLIIKDIKTSEV